MNIVEVKNLSKVYGKGETAVNALDNVSFSVKKANLFALSGRLVRENQRCFIYSVELTGPRAERSSLIKPIFII